MTDIIPYENYNPYPKIGNLSKEMYNASQRVTLCNDRMNKHYRGFEAYADIDELDELVTMKNATLENLRASISLLDLLSAEIMRLSV